MYGDVRRCRTDCTGDDGWAAVSWYGTIHGDPDDPAATGDRAAPGDHDHGKRLNAEADALAAALDYVDGTHRTHRAPADLQ